MKNSNKRQFFANADAKSYYANEEFFQLLLLNVACLSDSAKEAH
jgi:hypothetical protein